MKERGRFILGMIMGIVCTVLIFTGVYAATAATDKKTPGNTPGQENVGTNGKEDSDNSSEAGNLITQNGLMDGFNPADLMDTKASYIMRLVDSYFLYDVTQEDYQTAIYRALMNACNDPYSCYYTQEEYASMQESTSGVYCGIGCLVQQNIKTMLIYIVRPFKNSPAEKAGIKAGDLVYKVDGEEVSGQDINLVVSKMKGEADTKVMITVYRESTGEYLDMEVTRDFVEVDTVSSERLTQDGHKIGLITILEFDEPTTKQFLDALDDLQGWGAEGLIIDLRDNGGGLLDAVTAMLDPLLPEGLSVYMQDKRGGREDYTSDAACIDLPMAVIVNGNSASASEIFAGAVQDYGVATIVGTQSFGKGIVQSVVPLGDGSAVKLTIADYYTPKGRNIHGVGITPDLIVELAEYEGSSELKHEEDTQFMAALKEVLRQINEEGASGK
ncbi:MAG: S41 family peptidase [Lachnospiraceae bacterium]|nr:S41 family peptidase [Lachnospiraceae bacterium]